MKAMKKYLLSAVVMLLFTCTLMGIKVEAAAPAPAQVTGLKQTAADASGIGLSWTAVLGQDVDYQVEISMDKINWTIAKDSTAAQPTTTIGSLSAGTTYYVRVCGYTQESYDAPKECGVYSAVLECVTSPGEDPSYLKKTNSTTNTLTMEWGAVDGANAYVVYYAPDGTSAENAQYVIVTDTKVKLTKLQKNKNYTVEVCGVRRTSDGTATTPPGYDSYIQDSGFGVTPGKVSGIEVERYEETLGKLDVECKTIECADGYEAEVWTAYQKKDKRVASGKCEYSTLTTTYLSKAALKKHNFFKVRMRAYSLTSNGTKTYGAWSSWKYTCQQPTITNIKAAKKGMTVTWDKIKGADRYTIYASTKQTSGYKKIATTKKTSYTMKKFNKKALKKGKTYYFYVVAENKVGKKYYSGEAGNADRCWYLKNVY